jgi:hypothetical protein
MKDDFEATFVVELSAKAVWEALTERTRDGGHPGEVHYVLPGFPSLPPLDVAGASCTPLEVEAGRLLRVRKDHEPCAGTEIAVRLEQAGSGTRITVVQSGFGSFLDIVGRDTVFGHGHHIVADLRLYLERRITVPGTRWGACLGASTRPTPTGLEVVSVDPGGVAESAGLRAADLLLTLRGIRLHDLPQLWTVLALTEPGSRAAVTWARGNEPMGGEVNFAR